MQFKFVHILDYESMVNFPMVRKIMCNKLLIIFFLFPTFLYSSHKSALSLSVSKKYGPEAQIRILKQKHYELHANSGMEYKALRRIYDRKNRFLKMLIEMVRGIFLTCVIFLCASLLHGYCSSRLNTKV